MKKARLSAELSVCNEAIGGGGLSWLSLNGRMRTVWP